MNRSTELDSLRVELMVLRKDMHSISPLTSTYTDLVRREGEIMGKIKTLKETA